MLTEKCEALINGTDKNNDVTMENNDGFVGKGGKKQCKLHFLFFVFLFFVFFTRVHLFSYVLEFGLVEP